MSIDLLIKPQDTSINFMPESLYEEILQNVRTIVTTYKGSVPMDRAFGVSEKLIDTTLSYARAKLSGEIVQAIHEFESRVKVKRIDINADIEGRLEYALKIEIKT